MLAEQAEFLQQPSLAKGLKAKYLAAYLAIGSSWQPLWEGSQQAVQQAGGDKQVRLLLQARQDFAKGLVLMQQEEKDGSQMAFKNSGAALDELLRLALAGKALPGNLQLLLNNYDEVLAQEPLQILSLAALTNLQGQLSGAGDKLVKETGLYQSAQNYLKDSVRAMDDFKPLQARMYIEVGRFNIKELLAGLEPAPTALAEAALEKTLSQQALALKLNELYEQAIAHESVDREVEELLSAMQAEVMETAKTFNRAAIAQQKVDFSGHKRHLKYAWDEIIALFSEGQQAAQKAGELLAAAGQQGGAMPWQETAIKKWREALTKFHAGVAAEEQKAAPENPTAPATSLSQQAAFDDLLSQLQEMESDDRSRPELQTSPSNKGEERPW